MPGNTWLHRSYSRPIYVLRSLTLRLVSPRPVTAANKRGRLSGPTKCTCEDCKPASCHAAEDIIAMIYSLYKENTFYRDRQRSGPTAAHLLWPLTLTRIPTLMFWASTWALRSLLAFFWPRNFLRNLVLYFRLSPQTPHCHASRCWMPGDSSHVHLSIRPELHALASAWVSAAEDTASRNAVSLNADIKGPNIQKC